MKKTMISRIFFASVASLLVLSGCFKSSKKQEKAPALIVVNVLDQKLYDDCHIPGSIQIDFNKVADVAKNWSKSSKIVIYCANYACTASTSVTRDLVAQGFDAYDYKAGTAGWFKAGLPVVGKAESPYLHQDNEQPADLSHHGVPILSTEELKNLLEEGEVK